MDRCTFGNNPPALDDVDNVPPIVGDVRIDVGQPTENFITASAAAIVESSLLVFVGYNEMSGVSYLSGVSNVAIQLL